MDTEDDTLPPSACTASPAASRLNPSSVPVTTTVTPASGWLGSAAAAPAAGLGGGGGTQSGMASRTPAARHLSTMATCQSTPNHSMIEAAIFGPTPSAAASSSADAAAIASSEPNWAASTRAAVGPACRMDSATSTRHSGRVRASSSLPSSLAALTVRPPCLLTKNGTVASISSVSEKMSPSSVTRPESSSATTAS